MGTVKGKTAKQDLAQAARSGHLYRLKRSLISGADVNTADERGNTLLQLAAYHNHTRCVDLLLEAGADVKMENGIGNTALNMAACLEIVFHYMSMEKFCNRNDRQNDQAARCVMSLLQVFFFLPHLAYQPKSLKQLLVRCASSSLVSSLVSSSIHSSPSHRFKHRNYVWYRYISMSSMYAHQIFSDFNM